jgi:hypothetical protein
MQSTACMALHPVLERCCRWLLMTHDRMRRDHFLFSHEFLAMMLGATRPTVTVEESSRPGHCGVEPHLDLVVVNCALSGE